MYFIISTLAACALYVIYYRFLHPLAQYPGPFWASLTNLWSFRLSLRGQWPHEMDKLHRRYGNVVRIAPNEVCIDDPAAVSAIYSAGKGFKKTSFYSPFGNPKQKANLFNTQDENYHAQLRKWSASAFTMKTMLGFESVINDVIAEFLKELDKRASKQEPIDMSQKLLSFAFDVSGMISCGHRFGAIENGDSTGLMKSMAVGNSAGAHFGRLPIAQILFFYGRPPKELMTGLTYLAEFLRAQYDQHSDSDAKDSEPSDQMSLLMKSGGKTDSAYPLLDPLPTRIQAMSQTVIAAGSETTGSTLTALVYYIEKNAKAKQALFDEIESAEASFQHDGTLPVSIANNLPYVGACIKEALRLHPTVCYPIPRIVPDHGLLIGDNYFAPGTAVGVNAWQIHQHEEIFGERCREFVPERWLDADKEKLVGMEKHLFSFGAGARSCTGKHISLLEMRLLVPALYRAYDMKLAEGASFKYKAQWFAVPHDLQMHITRRK